MVVISAEGKQQQQETIIYYQQRHYFVNRILKGNSNTERANTKTAKSREVLDKIYCGLEERVLSIFLFESDWGGGGEYNRRVGREGEGGRQWRRRESNLDRAGRSNNSRGWGGGGEGGVRGGGGANPTLPKKELWSISEELFPILIHPRLCPHTIPEIPSEQNPTSTLVAIPPHTCARAASRRPIGHAHPVGTDRTRALSRDRWVTCTQ